MNFKQLSTFGIAFALASQSQAYMIWVTDIEISESPTSYQLTGLNQGFVGGFRNKTVFFTGTEFQHYKKHDLGTISTSGDVQMSSVTYTVINFTFKWVKDYRDDTAPSGILNYTCQGRTYGKHTTGFIWQYNGFTPGSTLLYSQIATLPDLFGGNLGYAPTTLTGSDSYIYGGPDSDDDPDTFLEGAGYVFDVQFSGTPEADGTYIGHGSLLITSEALNTVSYISGATGTFSLLSERNAYYYLDTLAGVVVRDGTSSWPSRWYEFALNYEDTGINSDEGFFLDGKPAAGWPGGGSLWRQLSNN